MTATTEPAPPAAPAAELKPGARFRRVGGALSLLGAGTLICISLLMIPYENETHAQYLQTGVEHQTDILWAAVVAALRLPAAGPGGVHAGAPRPPGCAEDVAGRDGAGRPRLGPVRDHRRRLLRRSPGQLAAGRPGAGDLEPGRQLRAGRDHRRDERLGIALGIDLAVYAAWRARAIPVYPLVLNVVGWLLFTMFSGDPWLPSLGTGLVAVGLGWAGLIVFRTRDEVWDRPSTVRTTEA